MKIYKIGKNFHETIKQASTDHINYHDTTSDLYTYMNHSS